MVTLTAIYLRIKQWPFCNSEFTMGFNHTELI